MLLCRILAQHGVARKASVERVNIFKCAGCVAKTISVAGIF